MKSKSTDQTQSHPPMNTAQSSSVGALKPQIVEVGKVLDITHGGGKIWGDGQKNQERQ